MCWQGRIQDSPLEGAPTLGGAPTYDFAKFSEKLYEIEKILIRHCVGCLFMVENRFSHRLPLLKGRSELYDFPEENRNQWRIKGRTRDMQPSVQILSLSCSFRQKCAK